ncbi:HAMP domain-containing sensor histidine kinase [Teredinibacter sp. KSP-S5-2]|uniref:HAMP domain-containing sensor histidine kinase n=1 Tax=Teredinibacter sp. KSP-S5-2 TaxID=3034506 RepID=UPI0029344F28|nr:HAMP domain-containing sensor histidine kinase [Teredinibacter sp. KSP-S5-2]WNO08412.1 HAMP domain-containing sensor histidine kinase [Teredinibacter sp. KSP-S5-2]
MNKNTIAAKIYLVLGSVSLIVISFTFIISFLSYRINTSSSHVIKNDLPSALSALAMLEELGNMNANLLEYVLGEKEEKLEYYSNLDSLNRLKKGVPVGENNQQVMQRLDRLILDHEGNAKENVFAKYDPSEELDADVNIQRLLKDIGIPMESLLDELKEEEIEDVGSGSNLEEIINDDLPALRYYLELVDEAGDMLADLDRFVLGDVDAKRAFFNDALQFEGFLELLKPLEKKPNELIKIREIERLFLELKSQGANILQRYNPQGKLAALKTIDSLEHTSFSEAEVLLEDFSAQSSKQALSAIYELNDLSKTIRLILILLSLFTMCFLVVISYYARRSVFRPIEQITSSIEKLRNGERDFVFDYESQKNELGEILKNIDQFQSELSELDHLRESQELNQMNITQQRDELQRTLDDLKTTQNKLIESEKMASLGSLVAGVAHEVNTPVGVGVTMASSLKRDVGKFIDLVKTGEITLSQLNQFETECSQTLDLLTGSLEKASNLIQNFKQVATDQAGSKRREFNLKETIDEIVSTLKHKIKGSKIQLVVDGESDVLMESFPGPLGQVIGNLFDNALIHGFEHREDGEIKILFEQDGKYVNINFCDNGNGIPEDNIAYVFNPFFTTKLGKGGSGLGLNIVHNIVTNVLGGSIEVKSDNGTRFEIRLPIQAPDRKTGDEKVNVRF